MAHNVKEDDILHASITVDENIQSSLIPFSFHIAIREILQS